jgi:hypothetical protein
MKAIYPHDVEVTVPVFHFEDDNGDMQLSPPYKDLACPECEKIDEERALQRGIGDTIVFNIKWDIFGSFESLYIVNDRVRSIFEYVSPGNVVYYPFPSTPGYYVAMPKFAYHPKPNETGFRFAGPGQCQRADDTRGSVGENNLHQFQFTLQLG